MSTTQTSFYVTGGTLQSNAASYVRRHADEDLYDGLSQGKFCYVLTSRQMGKSSLMVSTAARLRAEGVTVAVIDLTAIGQNLTAEQWYDGLLNRVGRQLDLEDELEEFWDENERMGPLQRWMRAVREVVLKHRAGRVVFFVDEIDAVRSLPFSSDEFFAGIREFYNRRTEDPELNRLTFCLLGVATPSDLIRDIRTTPFNIGQRIELTDFTEAEAAPLAEGLGRSEKEGRELLKRILYWTGGHPYLTQRLCQSVAQDEAIKGKGGVDRLCEELFLSARARERDDNLLFVRERILRSEADRAGLLDLYLKARAQKSVKDDEADTLVSVLRLSGVTRVVEGYLYVRNRIYYRVFDREWVISNMPDAEIRRQRAAYRRGMLRAASIAAVVLIMMAGLSVWALGNARKANLALAEARRERERAVEQTRIAEENHRRAVEQTRRADEETARAVEQEEVAKERQAEAERQRQIADEQTRQAAAQKSRAEAAARQASAEKAAAVKALETARRESERAEKAEESVIRLEEKRRGERFRTRMSLGDMTTILSLSDRLTQLASPREASNYRYLKASTLASLGRHEEARGEATLTLQTDPENISARGLRGYMYLIAGDARKSVDDFDFVIARDPTSSVGHLNRSISLGLLGGQSPDEGARARAWQRAEEDVESALRFFSPGLYGSLREDDLSEDVQQEVGRSVMVVAEGDFLAALGYHRANLRALSGKDFNAALAEADRRKSSQDAYLTAINWAWLHERHRPQDYGLLASQGAVWERLRNTEVAARYYARFLCRHQKMSEARYAPLAPWVEERLRALGSAASPCEAAESRPVVADLDLLVLRANESEARNDIRTALSYLNRALELQPENVELLQKRAGLSFALKDHARDDAERLAFIKQSKEDAERLLRITPTASAYFLRARAKNWLDPNDKTVEADLRKALELDPAQQDSLTYLAELVAETKPEEAVELFEKYNNLYLLSPYIYQRIAGLQLKLKRHAEALANIEAAIEMKPDAPAYYDLRAEAERGAGRGEFDVKRNLAAGYLQAGDILLRHGEVDEAVKAFERSRQALAELGRSPEAARMAGEGDTVARQKGAEVLYNLASVEAKLAGIYKASPSTPTTLEDVTGVITAIAPGAGAAAAVREVTIDRGSRDGLQAGADAEVLSVHAKAGQSDRKIQVIGNGVVLSVTPTTAAVRVTLTKPEGDGLVREGDAVEVEARVPKLPGRSLLWQLAKYHITFLGNDSRTVFLDYRKLYADQTPQSINQVLDAMVSDVRETGREFADQTFGTKPLETGRFKGKTLRQAMEETRREDVLDFLKFVRTFPGRYYGHEWKISETYATWIINGTPTE